MSAILFDLDGVLYEDGVVIDGAVETIEWFRRQQVPYLYLTNTSSRPRSALVKKLNNYGINTTVNEFLTPPLATARWLKKNHIDGPVALFIPEATKEEFIECEIYDQHTENADAVVIGDLGTAWDFDTLNRAFNILINNPAAKLIALGMTRYWRAQDGLRLDAGPFVTALQYATGNVPVVLGKPAPGFYESALNLLQVKADECYMIGDDIKGDIEAAQNIGINAIMVRTGKYSPADIKSGIKPDAILDSVADFKAWWSKNIN